MEPSKNFPNSFLCELTHQIMKNPVLDRDGHSYEKEAIIEYIQKNGVSPITLQPLSPNDLIPNIALRKTIEDYLQNKDSHVNDLNDQEKQKFNVFSANDIKVFASSMNEHVLLSLVPPTKLDGISRTPTTVVCVIDVSGSMGEEAKIKTDESSTETYGFNTLDLVKHAMMTIVKSLTKDDMLSLISFSNNAKVVLDLTIMDQLGRKRAYDAIHALQPDSQTNLWDGLYRGMEVLRLRNADGLQKNAAILLLTDGLPNVHPPRGHIPQLQKYKEDLGGELPGIINTFGFGYSLESKLLNEIAVMGKGTYAFIPDGSFVGTIFVNSMSNLLSSMAVNIAVEIDMGNANLVNANLLKHFETKTTQQKIELKLGSVLFGQNKNIYLPISFNDNENKVLKGTLKYSSPFQENFFAPFQIKIVNNKDSQAEISYLRVLTASNMLNAVEYLQNNNDLDLKSQSKIIEETVNQINQSSVKDDQYIKDLLVDLKEQVSIALSKKEFYVKWGRHYLPSLGRAHLLQQCNNFKDPGVQHFGGEIFKGNRDKLDQIFLNLPAPEPSIKRQSNQKVANMQMFYQSQGVCFHGNCSVLMMNGEFKLVKEIVQGDFITSTYGKSAKVKCVIKTDIETKKTGLVCLEGGLQITPWHPIKINDAFYFPINLGPVTIVDCDAVYNFVLEDHHIMKINGFECVTLGHGFDKQVAKHDYFGTQVVIKDLQKISGWGKGLVELKTTWILRDENTGIINSIRKN